MIGKVIIMSWWMIRFRAGLKIFRASYMKIVKVYCLCYIIYMYRCCARGRKPLNMYLKLQKFPFHGVLKHVLDVVMYTTLCLGTVVSTPGQGWAESTMVWPTFVCHSNLIVCLSTNMRKRKLNTSRENMVQQINPLVTDFFNTIFVES